MNAQNTTQEKIVAFYKLLHDSDAKVLIGAILVLDELGKPQEFRVTFPVKPTLIQRQLYGDALIPHVGVDLCGKPLFQALKRTPQLLVISHGILMGMAETVDVPVVHLERAGESLVVNVPAGTGQPTKQKINSLSGRFAPISVSYPPYYDDNARSLTASIAVNFFESIDLLEPFNRINVAIDTLKNQDERFR